MDNDSDNNENDSDNDENVIIKNDIVSHDDDSDEDENVIIENNCVLGRALCHSEVAFQMKRLVIQGRCSLSDNCMICLENMHRSKCIYLPCKHAFHSKCLKQLVERRIDTCPLCRAGFKDSLTVFGLPRNDEQSEMILYIQNEYVDLLLDWLRQSYEIVEE